MHNKNLQYFIYYLGGRILLWCGTQYVFPQIGFTSFIQDYRRYLIIISISYAAYCSLLTEEEKKYKEIQQALLIGNLYLFLHLFFRPLLNIEPALFILLGVCLFIMRNTKQLKKTIRRPLQILLGIISGIIIISGIFYLYPEAPDIKGFIAQQTTQLITISSENIPKYQAYLILLHPNTQKQQELQIQQGNNISPLTTPIKLKYISQTSENEEQIFILFPESTLIQIFPQSSLHITNNNIQIENGGILTYTPLLETTINIEGTSSSGQQQIYQNITQTYQEHLKKYLQEQIGTPFMSTDIVRTINKKALSILSNIFPAFFSQNLKNYHAFEQYFQTQSSIISSEKYTISNENTSTPNLREILKTNTNIGKPNLNVF